MTGLSRLCASSSCLPSVTRSSSARTPPALHVVDRFPCPLFRSAKIHERRALLVAALDVSKDGSSAVLANSQPSKGKAVAEWTAKAMTGTVPFEEALSARLSLIKPSLSQVEECLKKRPARISPGMADLVKKLKANNIDVFLASGGFRQMIKPVAFELGIPPENIIANHLLFDTSGEYTGFDPTEPTSRSGGKAKAVLQIKQDHGYKTVVMIGDGATDLEARQPDGADLFICYAGVQMREPVAVEADWVVFDFQELITKLS